MTRLLIIDDHEMVREGLKAMLVTEPDFDIVGGAANAQQALEMIEQVHPDVVLLDVRLPDASGVEVCRTLTERFPEIGVISMWSRNVSRQVREASLSKMLNALTLNAPFVPSHAEKPSLTLKRPSLC